MTTSPTAFINETMTFFANVDNLIHDVVPYNKYGSEEFNKLVKETFKLIFEDSRDDIINEFTKILDAIQIDEKMRNRTEAYDLLYLELKYFNTRFNYVGSYPPFYMPTPDINIPILPEISSKEKIESASIALKSVKDIFDKLPKWIQRILTVLGEILGIAKLVSGVAS